MTNVRKEGCQTFTWKSVFHILNNETQLRQCQTPCDNNNNNVYTSKQDLIYNSQFTIPLPKSTPIQKLHIPIQMRCTYSCKNHKLGSKSTNPSKGQTKKQHHNFAKLATIREHYTVA